MPSYRCTFELELVGSWWDRPTITLPETTEIRIDGRPYTTTTAVELRHANLCVNCGLTPSEVEQTFCRPCFGRMAENCRTSSRERQARVEMSVELPVSAEELADSFTEAFDEIFRGSLVRSLQEPVPPTTVAPPVKAAKPRVRRPRKAKTTVAQLLKQDPFEK